MKPPLPPTHLKNPNGPPPFHPTQTFDRGLPSDEQIAVRAYQQFVARGYVHGFDQDDWAAARAELLSEADAVARSP